MLIDARQLPDRSALSADVCIVGAGAAGITLARALKNHGISICLLESGGLQFDAPTQGLYDGTTTSAALPRRYLTTSRLRYFGGSTNHWNGMCRPLEPLDLAIRPWVADSGWPLTRDELAPYYRQAAALLQFDPFGDTWGEVVSDAATIVGPASPFVGRQFRMSPPTRFGQVYRDDLASADNVDVALWANALELVTNPAGSRVQQIRAVTLGGRRLTVDARAFVVAAGGVENARLLLASNAVHRDGLGNGSDCVGRYFMEHPELAGLQVMVTDHAVFGTLFRERDTMLCPTDVAQRDHEILNANVQFIVDTAPGASEASLSSDVSALLHAIDREPSPPSSEPLPDYLSLYIRAESAPRRENRVTLDAGERDPLGMPRARVTFAMGMLETRTVGRIVDFLVAAFGERSAGRVRFAHPDDALEVAFGELPWRGLQHGSHHMGTTRMSTSPSDGVVTRDCQVHGVDNLFIAGSSVFPTCGMANPTFTIVALALRLADHLVTRVGSSRLGGIS